jgi:hypothetical protein
MLVDAPARSTPLICDARPSKPWRVGSKGSGAVRPLGIIHVLHRQIPCPGVDRSNRPAVEPRGFGAPNRQGSASPDG